MSIHSNWVPSFNPAATASNVVGIALDPLTFLEPIIGFLLGDDAAELPAPDIPVGGLLIDGSAAEGGGMAFGARAEGGGMPPIASGGGSENPGGGNIPGGSIPGGGKNGI